MVRANRSQTAHVDHGGGPNHSTHRRSSSVERDKIPVPSRIRVEQGRNGACVEHITFDGYEFRRYPESKHRTHRLYFTGTYRGKKCFLHRAVWLANHEGIPAGHYVHHTKDEEHNQIQHLECLTPSKHNKHHANSPGDWRKSAKGLAQLERMRQTTKFKEWHRTEEGREVSRKNAVVMLAKTIKPTRHYCTICGKRFIAQRTTGVKYCSTSCTNEGQRRIRRARACL